MKRLLFFAMVGMFSLTIGAWENQDWLTGYDWFLEMDTRSPNHYDWHGYKTPYAKIKPFLIPPGSVIYRRRLRKEYFGYFYQSEKDHIFFLGYDRDEDGHDDKLKFTLRDNFSYMSIKQEVTILLDCGDRIGAMYDTEHPLVGIWGEPDNPSEFRLVEPAEYVYYLKIDKEIPGFAVRTGTYLFKQIGDTVFETDSSFPDGHMRLEIKDRDTLVLTPLFTLPDEEGLVEPLLLKRVPKRSN
jgi:hypothetical protein